MNFRNLKIYLVFVLAFCGLFCFGNSVGAFNVLTADPSGDSFYVGSQNGSPYDLLFADSGSKMYMASFGSYVYQYNLSVPYDITTASYIGSSDWRSQAGSYPNGLSAIEMSEDGTVMFGLQFYSWQVYQYNLSTPFDITSASYSGTSFYLSGYQNDYHMEMKPDGTKMYILSDYQNYIVQYDLSSAWDLSTAVYESRITIPISSGVDGQRLSMTISADGEHIFIETTNNELIHHVTLSTPWDVTSASYSGGNYFNASSYDNSVRGMEFSSDGDTMWLLGVQNDTVYEFYLNKPIIDSLTPADDATNVAVGSNLIMDFNEEVSTSTGSIILYDASDNSVVEEFPAGSSRISKSSDVITIDPTNNLDDDTDFYVTVPSTMFISSSSKYYAGISSSSTWSFSTIDLTAPTSQASSLVFSDVSYSSLTLSWTNGNGDGRVIFAKQANTGTASPVDTTVYSADSNFGDGDQIGATGWYAVYNGTGTATSTSITGLTPETDYIFQIFEYDLSGSDPLYLTSTATDNPNSQTTAQLTAPTSQATNLSFSSIGYNSMTVSWDRGNGEKVLIVAKEGATGTPTINNGIDYTASSVFGSGDGTGTGWYAVYNGTGTSVSLTGLSPGTAYRFQAIEYNGLGVAQQTYYTQIALNNPNVETTDSVATIYINYSTGNDSTGDGSSGNPYKTFTKAYAEAESGDTINASGTFTWSNADETGDAGSPTYAGFIIEKDLTIQGQGADQTIFQSASSSGSASKRIFTVANNIAFTISNATVRYGYFNSGSTYYGGACIYAGTNSNLTVEYADIHDCRLYGSYGGGIRAMGTASISNSSIHDNQFSHYSYGAGIYFSAAGKTMTVINSTIYDNFGAWDSRSYGAGIYLGAGNLVITNSTVISNGDYISTGGGIYVNNSADAFLYIQNTIVTDNTSNGSTRDNIYKGSSGTITSGGYNIVGKNSSSSYFTETTGDWNDDDGNDVFTLYSIGTTGSLNLDSQVSYNDDSNWTYTYGLLADSIAINNATTTANNGVAVPNTDQRGAGRNGETDIGAFEYEGTGLSVIEPTIQASEISFSGVDYKQMTISWTSGNGLKRTVFMKQANTGTATPVDGTSYSANSVFASGDQIGVSGWYAIYDGYSSSVSVTGLASSTDYIIQVFEHNGVNSGTVDYLTDTSTNNPNTQATHTPTTYYINYSTGNDSTGDGSAESPWKTFTKAYASSTGGDTLDFTGTFTWTNADETGDAGSPTYAGFIIEKDLTIQGNGATETIFQSASTAASASQRIFTIANNVLVTIKNATVQNGYFNGGNTYYGGACIYAGTNSNLTLDYLDINHCRLYASYGGGVRALGTASISNSSIHDNQFSHSSYGSGIYFSAAGKTMTITNSTIYDNFGAWDSRSYAAVYLNAGNIIMTNSTVVDNGEWGYSPGGIYVYNSADAFLYIQNTIVDNNTYSGTTESNIYKGSSGTITSGGYNIIGKNSSSSYFTETTGDWYDDDGDNTFTLYSIGTTGSLNLDSAAGLNSSLHDTYTYALLADSIAINNATTTANNGVAVPSADQRGAGRYSLADIGAFEYEGTGLEDLTAPTVSTLSPANEATDISKTPNLVITFDEAVATSSAKYITIKKISDDTAVETIASDSSLISINSAEVTINPSSVFEDLTAYYVEIDAGTFLDTSSNAFAGISGTSTWSFTVGDFTNPQVSTLSPSNNATNASLSVNLVITFNENVTAVADKNIVIKKTSDDSTIETIAANGVQVSISGARATVNPTENFAEGTGYYILIDSGAFVDEDSNPYSGISASSTWSFTTLLETVYANSSSGSDTTGNGTSDSPFATFYKAYSECGDACDTLDLTGTFTWTDSDELGDAATSGYTLGKNLTLQGHNPDTTIIQSAGYDNYSDRRVFTVSAGVTVAMNNLAVRYGRVFGNGNDGGGIKNSGNLTLTNCEVYNNRALGDGGGGISNRHTLTVSNSAIYNNVAYYMGGGLLNHYYVADDGYMTVTNSTIAYNQQLTSYAYTEGAGIHFRQGSGTLTNNTIAYNTARGVAGVGIDDASGTITMKNNIIAKNNRRGYSWGVDFGYRQAGYGNVVDNGNNIIGYSQNYTFTDETDWIGASSWGALLSWDLETFTKYNTSTTGSLNIDSALGVNSNSYKTQTLRLLTDSIAINNGATGTNGDVSVPTTDQRSVARISETDIGAFEFTGAPADTTAPTISSASASVSDTSAVITWTTNEASSSQVKYDANTSRSTFTSVYDSDPKVTSHEISLTGLVACSKYYYTVISKDASENWSESDEAYFYTTGCAGDASITEVTEASANPEEEASLSQTSGGLTIGVTIPTALAENYTDFQLKSLSASSALNALSKPANYSEIGSSVFDIKALSDPASMVSSFSDAVTVTVSYSDSEISGLDETTLWVHRHDGSSWYALDNCVVDSSANTVTCNTSNFSVFGLFGQTASSSSSSSGGGAFLPAYPPIVIMTPKLENDRIIFEVNNASKMAVSESSDFIGISWEDYENSYPFNDKVLYIKFLSPEGGVSQIFTISASGDLVSGFDISDYEGRLIKYENSPKVYKVENNRKRWIVSEEAFNHYGYNWQEIITISIEMEFADGDDIIKTSGAWTDFQFARNLRLGASGEDVRELQKFLNTNGFLISDSGYGSPGNETEYFGQLTKQALLEWQASVGLPAYGYFGPMTRALIN